ncbi:MAG: hypothetical protein RLZZ399_1845 [Verrucomicrobiota bacterium]|jgi:mono/diheme cytochrome c family protein
MPRFFLASPRGIFPLVFLAVFSGKAAALTPIAPGPALPIFLKEHCQECHRADKQKGKFRVDDLPPVIADVATAERWQKILNVLNAGEMPPEDAKQPPKHSKSDFLDQLANLMVSARKSLSDQKGHITLRRLNQREYRNTLRELLGVRTSVSELPADTSTGSFDTVGANLFMSANQFEQYRGLAREALDEAFERRALATVPLKQRVEVEEKFSVPFQRAVRWLDALDQAAARPENAALVSELRSRVKNESEFRKEWTKLAGAPDPVAFGFASNTDFLDEIRRRVGSVKIPETVRQYLALPGLDQGAYLCNFGMVNPELGFSATVQPGPEPSPLKGGSAPAGEYILRVRIAAAENAGAPRRFIEFGTGLGNQSSVLSTHEVTGTLEKPQILEIPFTLPRIAADNAGSAAERNSRSLFIRERGVRDLHYSHQLTLKQRATGITEPTYVIWVDWMELERVQNPGRTLPPGLAALPISLEENAPNPPEQDLKKALANFCLEAFRGVPAPPAYVDKLHTLYTSRRKEGDKHGPALRYVLSIVLSSPSFLYLEEPMPDSKRRRISPQELAVRLSYFLWGAPPDAHLRDLARSGHLSRPEVLQKETDRLLNDPRSRDFVKSFMHQWWGLDRLDFFQPDRVVFPAFDSNAKNAAREEVYETFAHLLRTNGSVRDLLKADYVVINGLLGQYYGLGEVHGDHFRKVPLPPGSPRGGVFGMAAFSYMGSNGQRTSPVERGAWVLRKVLNAPPPPAPANVPSLARLENQALTARQRILAHQEEPQCASCHRKIDPIGFGLENFDAAGQWRTEDILESPKGTPVGRQKTAPVDPAAAFHNGAAFRNYFELRDLIHQRSDDFATGLSNALIEYGLGRPCGFSDAPLLETMLQRGTHQNFRLREFIYALVCSEEFQTK